MEETDSIESINESTYENDGCNVSDNKLSQYMLINKELSKSLVVLRAENAKLRNNNKVLTMENLTYRNELTKNQNEITNWRKKFTKLQAMHIQHVETVTMELQLYADKLTNVFVNDNIDDENGEAEITSRMSEQQDPSISDSVNVPTRPSASSELSNANKRITDATSDDNSSSLNTITEESETDIEEVSDSEQISLVTSTRESSATDETTMKPDKTIVSRPSLSESCEMASTNSDKENERPSTVFSSQTSFVHSPLTIENRSSILTVRESSVQTIKKSITPLKEKFITQRRTHKRKTEDDDEEGEDLFYGFDNPKSLEIISSTPLKRKRSSTQSEVSKRISTPVKENTSDRMTRRSTMSMSASGRPKRSTCPTNFIEPKLNTKMRRPR